MSDALVAKALNDTLGTPEFKGLNTILDRQLGAFNEKFSTTLDDFNSVLKATLDDFAAKEVGRALKISENLYWKEPVELEYERNDSTPVTLLPFVLRFNLDGWVNLAIQTYGQHGKLYVNIYKNGEIFRDYAHSSDGAAKDDFLTACFVRKGDVFMNYREESLKKHREWRGKIETVCRAPVSNKEELCLAYTPGVAEPCMAIHNDIEQSFHLTRRWNTVPVITDGTAVLGLGDIGPEAGMPVMEGK